MYPRIFFEGDSGANSGGAGDGQKPPEGEKMFTQAELNAFLAKDKKELRSKNEQLVQQLEQLKQQSALTAQEKDELAGQIEQLRQQYMSKEELAAAAAAKEKKDYENKVKNLESERNSWRENYSNTVIENSILKSAGEAEAVSGYQIHAILRPMTKLEEELSEEGRPTGKYVPKVTYPTVDKEGQPITLTVTVPEAVKLMKEDTDRFGNLFKSNLKGGLGGQQSVNGKKTSLDSLKNTEAYMEFRKQHPDLVLPG